MFRKILLVLLCLALLTVTACAPAAQPVARAFCGNRRRAG